MITTTLNRIREHGPCEENWKKLLAGLGKIKADDEPLPYAEILRICGFDDALWATRVEPQYAKEWRLLVVAFARRVQDKMTDERSLRVLDVAEAFAHGKATRKELDDALSAAYAAYAATAAVSASAEREWQEAEFLRVVTETEDRA